MQEDVASKGGVIKMIRECIHCKKSRGGGSDVWCSEGHPYESYMRETECPYFEINRRGDKNEV